MGIIPKRHRKWFLKALDFQVSTKFWVVVILLQHVYHAAIILENFTRCAIAAGKMFFQLK
ncbi:TPA: hypothetical protein DDW35_00335 [Candidatus Sumerlaeota bacterium]|nr:hypothetical protein [Candidatus Sumerlaeota bacterium]